VTYHNLEELKELIASELDVDQILDILGWGTWELVEALTDEIRENRDDFEDAIR
jgi:hypothetical protein